MCIHSVVHAVHACASSLKDFSVPEPISFPSKRMWDNVNDGKDMTEWKGSAIGISRCKCTSHFPLVHDHSAIARSRISTPACRNTPSSRLDLASPPTLPLTSSIPPRIHFSLWRKQRVDVYVCESNRVKHYVSQISLLIHSSVIQQ